MRKSCRALLGCFIGSNEQILVLLHVRCVGEGLGSGRSGQADPVQAGQVKLNNLGVGAEQPGEVTAEDDIYEQYKKRMMLGYRYRPNPLVSRSFYPKKHCSLFSDT